MPYMLPKNNIDPMIHMENENFTMNLNLMMLPVNKKTIKRIVENVKDCYNSKKNIDHIIKYIDAAIEYESDRVTFLYYTTDRDVNHACTVIEKLKRNKEYVIFYDKKIKPGF